MNDTKRAESWVQLVMEARSMGLTPEEVRAFFQTKQEDNHSLKADHQCM
ncbi:anti-repressor SinI family protein [Alkalicoccus luteus]|uniref:DNA-binding anti-repressor SinI n=1 Tax=Alkalicoccus luteus TaxID=1237094 RepID=A0A969TVH3_9BACI|nr:anti-repressor SinI family protein [Alkalicoccus luteus]NJP38107.1 DNA-binding anti-repressor SinI [Alkalicoccus luteus]